MLKPLTEYVNFLPRTNKFGDIIDGETGWWHFHAEPFRILDNDGLGHGGFVIVKPVHRHLRAFHSFEIALLHWLLIKVAEPSTGIASYTSVQVRVINLVCVTSRFAGRGFEGNDTRGVLCDAIGTVPIGMSRTILVR